MFIGKIALDRVQGKVPRLVGGGSRFRLLESRKMEGDGCTVPPATAANLRVRARGLTTVLCVCSMLRHLTCCVSVPSSGGVSFSSCPVQASSA